MQTRFEIMAGTIPWLLAASLLGSAALANHDLGAAVLANSCAACHGPEGRSPGSIPTIAGKDAAYIRNSLRAFRDGELKATVMDRIARGYTDQEIDLIADFYGAPREPETRP
jgi:sulfide dehydrogenase cytochrome subunit